MHARATIVGLALLAAMVVSSACAKKHQVTRAPSVPAPRAGSLEVGIASWYGHPYHGRAAANGEIYDMEKLTAAHRTLPFGTQVRVTNLTNSKSVDVRITDRGPFIAGRIIDLSHAAAEMIGMIGAGVAQVQLQILAAPQPSAQDSWYAVQAGAFREKDRAERLRSTLEQEYGSARLVFHSGSPSLWRVLVGRERTEQAAATLASRVEQETGNAFVVRLDSSASPSRSSEPASSQP